MIAIRKINKEAQREKIRIDLLSLLMKQRAREANSIIETSNKSIPLPPLRKRPAGDPTGLCSICLNLLILLLQA